MKLPQFVSTAALVLAFYVPSFGKEGQPVVNPQVDKLVAVLKSDASQKEKADACRELARIGTKEAVAPLAALLSDEKLSHMARYGLETIPDPSVDDAFRDALGKLRGLPLVGVIGSIGVRHDAKAVPMLAGLLKSADSEVVEAAARALGSIADRPAAKALEDSLAYLPPADQPAVWEGLFRCAEAFAAKGSRSQAVAIYDRLRSNQMHHQIRAGALRGSILNRKDGLDLLLQVLHSADYSLSAAAVHVSLEMPGGEVTSALSAELPTLPADRQILVIQMLGRRSDPRALPALSTAAKEGPQPVRIAAIRALAELDDAAATPLLVGLLGDADHEVARQAQETLGSLQGRTVDGAVLAMIESSQTNRCIAGMELAVRRRMPEAMSPMYKVATRGEPVTRVIAVRKLADLAPPSELPAFFDLLAKAQGPAEVDATEQALGTMCLKAGDADRCAQGIAGRFAQAQPDEKCALLRVLGSVGGPNALQQVRAAINETNAAVHAAAIRALGSWNSLDATPELLTLAQNASDPTDKTLCLRSFLGLAGHTDFPADPRLTMCRQAAPLVQKEDEKKLFLAAAGNLNSPEALELIKPYLEDVATREEAAAATVNISEKVLQGSDASRLASKLVEPLENVAQLTSNTDLADRAKKLLEQAKTKQK